MFKQEDILKMLQEGQDADTIVKSFTDAVNGAINEKAQLDAQANAATKEKIAAAQGVIDTVLDFIEEFYPDAYSDTIRDALTGEELVDTIDEAIEQFAAIKPLLDMVGALEGSDIPKAIKPAVKVGNPSAAGDPLAAFLKANGLN